MEYSNKSWVDELEELPSSILQREGSTTVFTPSISMIISGRIWVPQDIVGRG